MPVHLEEHPSRISVLHDLAKYLGHVRRRFLQYSVACKGCDHINKMGGLVVCLIVPHCLWCLARA